MLKETVSGFSAGSEPGQSERDTRTAGGPAPVSLSTAHLHERAEVDRAESEWLEPFRGDVGAERDEARHVDHGWGADW